MLNLRYRKYLIAIGVIGTAFIGGMFLVETSDAATLALINVSTRVTPSVDSETVDDSVTVSVFGTLTATKAGVTCEQEAGGPAPYESWYTLVSKDTSPSGTVQITGGPFSGTIPVTVTQGVEGTGCFDAGRFSTFGGSRTFDTSSLANGTYTVTVRVTSAADGVTDTGSVSFTVDHPVSAPTVNISASPTIVSPSGSTTLSWSTTNSPTSCSASGSWSGSKATSGSQTVTSITGTRTYTITCSNAGGSDSDSVTVNVLSADIKANSSNGPITIAYGSSATLSWSSSNANFCDRIWVSNGFSGTSGSVSSGALTSSQTFTISCATSDLSATDSDSVVVNVSAPPSSGVQVDLKGNGSDGPITISSGGNVTLSWAITQGNANSCYSTSTDGRWTGNRGKNGGSNTVRNITGNATYSITCTDLNGSDQDSVDVLLETSAPTVTISPETFTGSADAPKDHAYFDLFYDSDGIGPVQPVTRTVAATWTSSNPDVARFQGTGFTAADFICSNAGTVTITGTYAGLSDTATMTCTSSGTPPDTSPTFRVSPKTASGAVGQTLNFDSYYDSDGSGPETESNWTISTSWSSGNTDIATFQGTGSFVAKFKCDAIGIVTITGSAQGLSDTSTLTCGPAVLSCSPESQPTQPNQNVTLGAFGGTSGSYQWSAPGGVPSSGSGSSFTTKYSTLGTKYVTLTRGSESDNCSVNVTSTAPQYIDIGLRVYDGSTIHRIAAEPQGTLTSPLRIAKDGVIYGVVLVSTSDPMATPARVETSSGIRALRGL